MPIDGKIGLYYSYGSFLFRDYLLDINSDTDVSALKLKYMQKQLLTNISLMSDIVLLRH